MEKSRSVPKTTLVLLTLNEIQGLRALYDRIPFDAVDEVIGVDGGSTDGTVEFLREKGVRVVQQQGKGRGSALILGGQVASGDAVLFFSPDGNEDPRDIPRIVERLGQGFDLVIASRFLPGGQSDDSDDPLRIRRLGDRTFTALVNWLWKGFRLTDVINGYRGIQRSVFQRLNLDATYYEIELQMTIRCKKLECRITELPTIEFPRVGGRTKSKMWKMGVLFTRALVREILLGRRFLNRSSVQGTRTTPHR